MTIMLQFLRSLRRCLEEHLHLSTDPDRTFGTHVLTVRPSDRHTFMKVRLVLSWMEGSRVMYLSDAQVELLFKRYCMSWCYNLYNLREQGYKNITNEVPE